MELCPAFPALRSDALRMGRRGAPQPPVRGGDGRELREPREVRDTRDLREQTPEHTPRRPQVMKFFGYLSLCRSRYYIYVYGEIILRLLKKQNSNGNRIYLYV